MGYISLNEKTINITIDNILFVKTSDLMEFYYLITESKIKVYDEVDFMNKHRSIIITPITLIGDLINFSKTNCFGKKFLENEQWNLSNLFNENTKETIFTELQKYFSDIEMKQDFDYAKILNFLLECNGDKNITKKEFLTFIECFERTTLTNLMILNPTWFDDDCIEKIKEKNIKTVIVFNDYQNIKKYVVDDINNVVVITKNDVCIYDEKNNISNEDKSDDIFGEKVFLKF